MRRPIQTTLAQAQTLAEAYIRWELLPTGSNFATRSNSSLNEGSLTLVAERGHLFTFQWETTLEEEWRYVASQRDTLTGVLVHDWDNPVWETRVTTTKWQATFACHYGAIELRQEHCIGLRTIATEKRHPHDAYMEPVDDSCHVCDGPSRLGVVCQNCY